jgi:type IV pilus biogenesis protein CpaD/CtpE
MTSKRPIDVNFVEMAAMAARCAEQWRSLAATYKDDSDQGKNCQQVARLFEQQSRILTAMHKNRVEMTRPTRGECKDALL